jgi:SHS2 domain-containing protein
MYETFEHTADMGLRIRGGTLDELFEEAGCALFATIVEGFDRIRPVESRAFELRADRHDELLHDWLAELLYTFHVDHLLFARFEVRVASGRLRATAWGEPLDDARHRLDAEIKAVTYHGLKVEPDGQGWLAEVIVDI